MSNANTLFLDDEENVLHALKRLFIQEESYQVFVTTSPDEALRLASTEAFSVIVSDQRMPEMLGTIFLEKVKRISPNTIRVMLTGYADLQATTDAITRSKVSRYITKPWDNDELRNMLRNILKGSVDQFNENTDSIDKE